MHSVWQVCKKETISFFLSPLSLSISLLFSLSHTACISFCTAAARAAAQAAKDNADATMASLALNLNADFGAKVRLCCFLWLVILCVLCFVCQKGVILLCVLCVL